MVLSVICFTVTSIPFSWKILFILSKDFIYSSRRWYFGSLQLKYCSIPDHASVKAKISSSSYSLLPLSHFCTGRPLFFLISTSLSVVSVVSSTRSLQLSSFEFLHKVKFDTKSNNNVTFGNTKFQTVCYYHVTYEFHSESTIYSLPECQGTPCSKQAPYLKFKWQRHDSNPQPLSS